MKIKTCVKIVCSVFVALVVFLAAMFAVISSQMDGAIRNDGILSEMTKEISELNILTADYLIHPNRRSREQWMVKRGNIARLLNKSRFVDGKEKILFVKISRALKETGAIHSKLFSGYGERTPGGEGVFLFQEYQERLIRQALIKTLEMSSAGFQLSGLNRRKVIDAQERKKFFVIIFVGCLAVVLVGTSLFVVRRILRPVEMLSAGAEIVGAGDLEYRIGVETKDEIGELSVAFDRMTQKLGEAIASRDKEITEREQAEEKVFKINRTLRMLSDCNQALLRSREEEELLQEVCRVIVEVGGYPLAWVSLAEKDEEKTLRLASHWGPVPEHLYQMKLSWGDNERGRTPSGRAIRTREPIVVRNLPSDSQFAQWRTHAKDLDVGASATFPLLDGERPIGALAIYSKEADAFDAGEMDILAENAADLSYGIRALRNVEARRVQEEALQLSEERTRSVVNSAYDGIVTIDKHGIVDSFSPAAEEMFGYSPEEVIGQNVKMLMPEPYMSQHDSYVADYLHTGQKKVIGIGREVSGRRKDGTAFPLDLRVNEFSLGGRRVFVGTLRDITERKRAETLLELRAQDLARSNADLEQFAYVASHDLQEPLRMVSSYVQLLAKRYEGKLDSDADEFIAYAVDGAARMQGLIQDLLAYSRVGSRGKEFEKTESTNALEQALHQLQGAIEETAAVVTNDELPIIEADQMQLTQLFQNLVGNALKFHREKPHRVHVSAERNGTEWIFSVRDNGIGIEPQYASRIFTIFQRLHTREEYPGTGIGLAICKRIVERHGGRIWVESQFGEGTTFSFAIPDRGDKQS